MRQSVALAAGVITVGCAGCLDSELNRSGTAAFRNQQVETPTTSPASVAAAARVDQIGRQLVAQSPFLGVEPTFQMTGRREPEIYHPDSHGVFVTEGLIEQCKSDAEVAAVLASELAKMAAEQRAADRMRKPEPMRAVVDSGAGLPGATGPDQNQLGMQALIDQKIGRSGRGTSTPPDLTTATGDIVQAAGFDRAAVDAVKPLLREAGRNRGMATQFGGRGVTPQWSY